LDLSPILTDRRGVDWLIAHLEAEGYEVVGPTIADGAVVYGRVRSTEDLPIGWTDVQGPGEYRLVQRDDDALFGYVVGPTSPKQFLHPPQVKVWTGRAHGDGVETIPLDPAPRRAFLGVRPCDLAAIDIQDRVFLGGSIHDAVYEDRRRSSIIIAIDCTEPGETCFCSSLGTGPAASDGFDLAMTELPDGTILVRSGSDIGDAIKTAMGGEPATEAAIDRAHLMMEAAAERMGRSLQTAGLKELLYRAARSPHWDEVAARCLTCSNCTMVCPTCFCAVVDDEASLNGDVATRTRRWDSCFSLDFSYIHGGSVRTSGAARYRQWMTHKLASWQDQFGVIGCVGCGRCITWCPVGIDITAEATAIRDRAVSGLEDPSLKEAFE